MQVHVPVGATHAQRAVLPHELPLQAAFCERECDIIHIFLALCTSSNGRSLPTRVGLILLRGAKLRGMQRVLNAGSSELFALCSSEFSLVAPKPLPIPFLSFNSGAVLWHCHGSCYKPLHTSATTVQKANVMPPKISSRSCSKNVYNGPFPVTVLLFPSCQQFPAVADFHVPAPLAQSAAYIWP